MTTGCFLNKVLKLMLQTCCYRSGQSRLVSIGGLSIRLYLFILVTLEVLYQEAPCVREEIAPRPLCTERLLVFRYYNQLSSRSAKRLDPYTKVGVTRPWQKS